VREARPTPCAGSCPEHPACSGLIVRRPLSDLALPPTSGDLPNAQCGRCGALYSWDGGFLTYLNAHDRGPEKDGGAETDAQHDQRVMERRGPFEDPPDEARRGWRN
jgi:hypothetical protein